MGNSIYYHDILTANGDISYTNFLSESVLLAEAVIQTSEGNTFKLCAKAIGDVSVYDSETCETFYSSKNLKINTLQKLFDNSKDVLIEGEKSVILSIELNNKEIYSSIKEYDFLNYPDKKKIDVYLLSLAKLLNNQFIGFNVSNSDSKEVLLFMDFL